MINWISFCEIARINNKEAISAIVIGHMHLAGMYISWFVVIGPLPFPRKS